MNFDSFRFPNPPADRTRYRSVIRLSVTGESGRIKLRVQCGESSVEGFMSTIRP